MSHQNRIIIDPIFIGGSLVAGGVPHHQDVVGSISLFFQGGDAGGLAARVLTAEDVHRIGEPAADPFFFHSFPVGAGNDGHVRHAMGSGQALGHSGKGFLLRLGQGVDGGVDLLRPGEGFGQGRTLGGLDGLGEGPVGEFRGVLGPGGQLFHPLDGGVLLVDLGQGQSPGP